MEKSNEEQRAVPVSELPRVEGRWPGSCFGCGEGNAYGLHLQFHHTDDGVVAECQIPAQYCGFEGIAHGGIISTVMDEAATWAVFAKLGKTALTRELTVRFLQPVRTGQTLRAQSRLGTVTEKYVEVSMTLHDQAGVLLAEARSSWVFVPPAVIAKLVGADGQQLQAFVNACLRKS